MTNPDVKEVSERIKKIVDSWEEDGLVPFEEFCKDCDRWVEDFTEDKAGAVKGTSKGCAFLLYDTEGKSVSPAKVIYKTSEGYMCRFNNLKRFFEKVLSDPR